MLFSYSTGLRQQVMSVNCESVITGHLKAKKTEVRKQNS